MITHSRTNLSRFCGQQGPPLGTAPNQREIVSSGNRWQLTFCTDDSTRSRTSPLHKGFLALYHAMGGLLQPHLPCPGLIPEYKNYLWRSPPPYKLLRHDVVAAPLGALQVCPTQGIVLLAQRLPQKLTSPQYPEPYLEGLACTTDIEAPEGFAVKLVFQDFDLEPSPLCERDSITITDSGADLGRFCGQQGPPLGSAPGQTEFVTSGNRLQLTFRTDASTKNRTSPLHKGFLALYQAVAVNSSQPIGQASGGSEPINTPGDSPPKAQNHCQEPYYQVVPAAHSSGTLTCAAQGPWKDAQDREEVPRCVPVCGRPVTPIAPNQEALGSPRAKLGSFPWQALTLIYGRGGGALLGDRWVLTAAHTLYPKDLVSQGRYPSVDVFLGHTHVEEMMKLGNYPVRRVFVHPDYHQNASRNFNGDIALLELQDAVPLGPNLLPVCLPDNETQYLSGLWGYVSGFGIEKGRLAKELKYSRLPVAPRKACEAWLQQRQRTEVFSDNMFCVEGKTQEQGVCQGDSGGVFVVWDDRALRWVATGIVSWGIGCGQGYDFYTKVLSYVDWVKAAMEGQPEPGAPRQGPASSVPTVSP